MPDIAVHVDRVSKCYRLGERQSVSYHTLRDHLADALSGPWRRLKRKFSGTSKPPAFGGSTSTNPDNRLWALKEVSLDIRAGEALGIIGANGAGKSTLLKVLSRITEPTEGWIDIYGRVGSLLEVGTGFHPELTGRENVFLNGAILRMTRQEIRRKFDAIVSFAEVERFVDMPVKHYSSGMYLRLAFAVAAHMEPEILLVDEVLAVGDASFQKKCLGKMKDFTNQGRTVIFVSHSLPAITRLCNRAILLGNGRLLDSGDPHEVVSAYLGTGLHASAVREWPDPLQSPRSAAVRLRAVRVRDGEGRISGLLDIRHSCGIEMEFDVLKPGCVLMPHFWLTNEAGVILFSAHDLDPTWRKRARLPGHYTSTVHIPGNFLSDGMVFVNAGCVSLNPVVQQEVVESDVVAFRVAEVDDGNTARGDYPGYMDGAVRPLLQWTTDFQHAGDDTGQGETVPPTANEASQNLCDRPSNV